MPPAGQPRTCCSTRELIQLSPEAWEQFNALLDAPARDIPALRSLLASKPVWKA